MRYLFLFASLLGFLSGFSQLSGTFTVGGTSPNYTTLWNAVQDLQTKGINGPVVLYLRSDTVHGSMSLTAISGSSSTNTITLLGDTSSSYPTYQLKAGTFTALFTFNGIQNVRFKNIAMDMFNGTYPILAYKANTSNVVFEDCVLGDPNGYGVFKKIQYKLSSSSPKLTNFKFINNTFWNAKFRNTGRTTSLKDDGFLFTGNTFTNVQFEMSRTLNVVIKENQFDEKGAYFWDCPSFKFNTNKINSTIYGITVLISKGTASKPIEINNNFISVSHASTSAAITINGCDKLHFVHNSIYTNLSISTTPTLNYRAGSSSDYVKVWNNNFHNEGKSNCINTWRTDLFHSNFNNWYRKDSTNFAYSNSLVKKDLKAWQAYSAQDSNSYSIDPAYQTVSDLHTDVSFLNNKGDSIGLTRDIDGEVRSLSTPDIGADEYTPPTRNINLKSILQGPCLGVQDIQIRFKNEGIASISSARIKWQISLNGGTPIPQTDYNLSTTLSAGTDTLVTLGSLNFTANNYYDILVYVDSVNGGLDQRSYNDTLRIDSAYSSLHGRYTIGGANPDFYNLEESIKALEKRGVCGPVIFDIVPGIYQERLHILNRIKGSSWTNTITYRTDTSYSGQAVIFDEFIRLDSNSHFRFHNLELRQGTFIIVTESDIEIVGCKILPLSTSQAAKTGITMQSSGGSRFLIENNYIGHCWKGIVITTGSSGNFYSGKILNNVVENFTYFGFQIEFTDSVIISNNQLIQDPTVLGVFTGMSVGRSGHATISNNVLTMEGNSNSTRGIAFGSSEGDSLKPSVIRNNFISIDAKSGQARGISLNTNDYLEVANNSVNVQSNPSNSYAFHYETNRHTRIYNNSFVHSNGGKAIRINTYEKPDYCNYNNLFTTGSVFGEVGTIGYSNRLAWVAATTYDSSSIAVDPKYFSKFDLHTSSPNLNNAGIGSKYVVDDIDYQTRGINPDIGADEYVPVLSDGGLLSYDQFFCKGSNPIKVRLKNIGNSSVTAASIRWWVSKNSGAYIPQSTYNFSGTIANGKMDTLSIGSITMSDTVSYNVKVVISGINSGSDSNSTNDTILYSVLRTGMSGVYSIGNTGDFRTIFSADSALDLRGMCDSVVFDISQGTYDEQVVVGGYNKNKASNLLTIKAKTGNTMPVNWTSGTNTLILDQAQNVHIEDLSISTKHKANTVFITGRSKNVIINKNVINGSKLAFGSYSYEYAAIQILELNDTLGYIKIKGNNINNGGYGISTSKNSNKGTEIDIINNKILGFKYQGISLIGTISSNIEQNHIKGDSISALRGIRIAGCNNLSIIKNQVQLYALGAVSFTIDRCKGSKLQPNLIANNMFSCRTDSVHPKISHGGSVSRCDTTNFYFNSINLAGNSGPYFSFALGANDGTGNKFFNNSVVNVAGGIAIQVRGTNEYLSADYNNFYAPGNKYLGFHKSTSAATSLADWKTKSGVDKNSVSGNPLYKSELDLHAQSSALLNKGIGIIGITDDIDGDTRLVKPDIGADEYAVTTKNVGVVAVSDSIKCSGKQSVYVKVKNFGTDWVTSTKVEWALSINFGTPVKQGTIFLNDSIAPNSDTVVYFGDYNYAIGSLYRIIAYTDSVNGGKDFDNTNDSLTGSAMIPAARATLSSLSPICSNLGVVSLSSGSPKGGTYIGSFIKGNKFNADSAGGGRHVYGYTYTASNGCVDSAYSSISVVSSVKTDLGVDTGFCIGDTLLLQSNNSSGSHLWNNGDTNRSLQVVSTGNYWLLVIDSSNCKSTDSINIVSSSGPNVQLGNDTSFCDNPAFVLNSGDSSGSHLWSTGDTTTYINVKTTGLYSVRVKDSLSCSNTDSINIVVFPSPIPNLGPDTSFCGTHSYVLKSNLANQIYLWNTGGILDSIVLAKGGKYWLQVTDTNACFGSDTINVSYKAICVGIDENLHGKLKLKCFPNPSDGKFEIHLEGEFRGQIKAFIRDLNGREIQQQLWQQENGFRKYSIDLRDEAKGIYMLELNTAQGTVFYRLTIQ